MGKTGPDLGVATPQQERFIKLKARGATTMAASRGAGYSAAYGYDLMKKESIKLALAHEMERSGINMESISNKIAEGFESMAPPRKDGGIQYADMFTRRQYVDMALRILGLYAPEELNVNQRVINITISPEMSKGLIDAQVLDSEELEELYAEDDGSGYIEGVTSEKIEIRSDNRDWDNGREEESPGGTGQVGQDGDGTPEGL